MSSIETELPVSLYRLMKRLHAVSEQNRNQIVSVKILMDAKGTARYYTVNTQIVEPKRASLDHLLPFLSDETGS